MKENKSDKLTLLEYYNIYNEGIDLDIARNITYQIIGEVIESCTKWDDMNTDYREAIMNDIYRIVSENLTKLKRLSI